MTDVLSYRQFAADCLRQAEDEPTPVGRTILLNVALAWLRLAQQTEAVDEPDQMPFPAAQHYDGPHAPEAAG